MGARGETAHHHQGAEGARTPTAAVGGASGFTGEERPRPLSAHPVFEVVTAGSAYENTSVGSVHPDRTPVGVEVA